MQYEEQTSLFGCDEYTVYTNQSLAAWTGFEVSVVNVDLDCQRGGEMQTQLNVHIFEVVWQKVISDGRFRLHSWTVKVEADTVFFPTRLRSVLSWYTDPDLEPRGVYLNNCQFGLLGPIEVFSRTTVEVLGMGWQDCRKYFRMACSGPCWWSEDLFIDQCLSQVLHVKRESEYSLLSAEKCSPPEGWMSCEDHSKVAFHPFKDPESYQSCLEGVALNGNSAWVFKK